MTPSSGDPDPVAGMRRFLKARNRRSNAGEPETKGSNFALFALLLSRCSMPRQIHGGCEGAGGLRNSPSK